MTPPEEEQEAEEAAPDDIGYVESSTRDQRIRDVAQLLCTAYSRMGRGALFTGESFLLSLYLAVYNVLVTYYIIYLAPV
jgi:hypothetical protein